MGFSLRWPLLLQSIGSRLHGLQQLWLLSSRAQAQQSWCTGWAALRHVGSSWIKDRTVSPALAGGFFPTEPTGSPQGHFLKLALNYLDAHAYPSPCLPFDCKYSRNKGCTWTPLKVSQRPRPWDVSTNVPSYWLWGSSGEEEWDVPQNASKLWLLNFLVKFLKISSYIFCVLCSWQKNRCPRNRYWQYA